jgi:hypothetical protein
MATCQRKRLKMEEAKSLIIGMYFIIRRLQMIKNIELFCEDMKKPADMSAGGRFVSEQR